MIFVSYGTYLACEVVILRAGGSWTQLRFLHHLLSPLDTATTSTVQYEFGSQVGGQEETSLKQTRDDVVKIGLAVKLFLFESQPLGLANS